VKTIFAERQCVQHTLLLKINAMLVCTALGEIDGRVGTEGPSRVEENT
jgi:hypothetical protein